MKCTDRDSDLLLLSHAELGPLRRGLTKLHLSRCARCQARLRELASVSVLLAQTLGPSSGGRPSGGARIPHVRFAPAHVAVVVLSSLAIVGSLAVLTSRIVSAESVGAMRQVSPSIIGCRPGLPNDHCR